MVIDAGAVPLVERFALLKQEYLEASRLRQLKGGENARRPAANDDNIVASGHGLSMLVLDLEPSFEAFYLSPGVDDSLFTGEKGVASATDLDPQRGLSCADGEGIAAGTDNPGLIIIRGVNLLFHLSLFQSSTG